MLPKSERMETLTASMKVELCWGGREGKKITKGKEKKKKICDDFLSPLFAN